jgi:hypothetical protein
MWSNIICLWCNAIVHGISMKVFCKKNPKYDQASRYNFYIFRYIYQTEDRWICQMIPQGYNRPTR